MASEILILIAVNFLIYARTMAYGFVSDDINVADRKIDEETYWHKDQDRKKEKPRKVKNWFDRQKLQLFGRAYFQKREARFLTILIHTVNCILIYYVFGHNNISFLAAILFSINPVNTQGGSIWLSGKVYSMSTMWALLMFALPHLSPGFYWVARWYCANAMFSPLAFIMTKQWYYVFLLPLGIWFYKEILVMKSKTGTNREMKMVASRKVLPFIKSFGYYATLCLIPHCIALYHKFLWGIGVNPEYNKRHYRLDRGFWRGVLVIILMGFGIVKWWGSPFSFGLLWFTVNISMWCNFITYQQQISERYVYTANAGMMVALAAAIINYPIIIAVFLTFYFVRLWFIMPMYQNEFWHTLVSANEARKCNYIWIAWGMKKFRLQDFVGAYYDFLEARTCTPWEFKANFNAANMAVIMQDIPMAKRLLEDAEKCPYEDQEEMMLERVKKTKEWIAECEKTKSIDLRRVQVVK